MLTMNQEFLIHLHQHDSESTQFWLVKGGEGEDDCWENNFIALPFLFPKY